MDGDVWKGGRRREWSCWPGWDFAGGVVSRPEAARKVLVTGSGLDCWLVDWLKAAVIPRVGVIQGQSSYINLLHEQKSTSKVIEVQEIKADSMV